MANKNPCEFRVFYVFYPELLLSNVRSKMHVFGDTQNFGVRPLRQSSPEILCHLPAKAAETSACPLATAIHAEC